MSKRNLIEPCNSFSMKRSFVPTPSPTFPVRPKVSAALPVILLAGLLLQGCSSMGTDGHQKSAALGRLSPADRQVAMNGEVRRGFSKDAVYAAWGAPSKTSTTTIQQGVRECWTYTQTFNGYGGGYYGISRGLVHGKKGDHYDTDDFYPAPDSSQTLGGTPSTEVPVKRAVFENGRVVSFETDRADARDRESDAGE